MRTDLTKKRTFLICGHAQSGKTSLAEAIIYKCGAVTRLGKVDDGTSISDYEDDEKERKSSINMSVLGCEYKGNSLQFIDVPGYLDFVAETIAASRAADFAVITVDSTAGVQVGTEKAWEIIRKENIPCLFVVTKLDKPNTSFESTVKDIQESMIKTAVPFVKFEAGKVSAILQDRNSSQYSQIVDKVAETDDALLSKYLETGTISDSELDNALEKAVINAQVFPIVAAVPVEGNGVLEFLDLLTTIMPPVGHCLARKAKDPSGNEVSVEPKVEGQFAAQVFKTIIDPFVGQLTLLRIYSGKLNSNSEFYNVTRGSKEKFGSFYFLQGKQQIAQDGVCCGDICAIAKLKEAHTGDSLGEAGKGLEFEPLIFPEPLYSASVKPKTRHDEEKISAALQRLMSEDITCKTSQDPQTKELLVSGMGELHINVLIGRMKRRYQVEVEIGKPKVPYLETVTRQVKVSYKHKKQSGGHGQYGDVSIEVGPLERGKEFEFVNQVVGGAIPRNYIPSVEKGVRKAMEAGVVAGFPVKDVRVALFDGSYHDVDSSDMAFQIAASTAFRKALEQAGSVLLEPIMEVEVSAPEDLMGQITGEINTKRGRVLGMETKGKTGVVKADIPLAEMFKYASELRSVTGGRGSYTMHFSHYETVPPRLAQEVVAQSPKVHQHAEV